MIQQLLQQLSEAAPGVCRLNGHYYRIGDYRFSFSHTNGELLAWVDLSKSITGDPAHAWLRDALEREIARRGWSYETSFWISSGQPHHRVYLSFTRQPVTAGTREEALLSVLIVALGASTSPAGDAGE